MPDPGVWAGRRVLLTGHTGFKGSWLALWLKSAGAEVTGLALPPSTTPSLFEAADVAKGLDSRIADLRNPEAVDAIVATARPEVVFHLAAQPLVRQSYADPVQTYATNVMGTAHLLDALRRTGGARAIVVVTTDKCYENREWVWPYREDDPLGGHDPYSSSKACAEIVSASFRRSFFSPSDHARHGAALATARAGNVIGGGDWSPDRLVPDLIRAFAQQEAVVIRNPDAVRPWQHVLDSLSGYLHLAEALLADGPEHGEAYNFGPSEDGVVAVRNVVDLVAQTWGGGAGWRQDPNDNPHEATLLRLDSSKARAQLGWRPRLDVTDAVRWTVDWYKAVAEGADARALTLAQIAAYEARADGA